MVEAGEGDCDLTLAPRWIPESIRWMVLNGRSSKALKVLKRVATFNGKKEEGKKLSLEVGAERGGNRGRTPCSACPLLLFPLLRADITSVPPRKLL